MNKILSIVGLLFFALIYSGCGIYSFTGASIPPEVKTISIGHFENQANQVQPILSQTLTDALKDRFLSQTSLNVVNGAADMSIEGAIVNYITAPVAIQSDDKAALNRLTVGIRVKFINEFDETKNFESTFSRYEDYDSKLSLSTVEDALIKNIVDALVEDIFNKTVVNW
ncbi:MAG: LptE family protein [Bacteroidales bacterium]|nr:LptE family protein [Bacteroidales bacterium]